MTYVCICVYIDQPKIFHSDTLEFGVCLLKRDSQEIFNLDFIGRMIYEISWKQFLDQLIPSLDLCSILFGLLIPRSNKWFLLPKHVHNTIVIPME